MRTTGKYISPSSETNLPVEYPRGVDTQPRDDPRDGEADEHEVAHLLVVGVLAQLRSLQNQMKFYSTNEDSVIKDSQSHQNMLPRIGLPLLMGP